MRLDALLVRLGLGSRSQVQRFIRAGAVAIGDEPVRDPRRDIVPGVLLTVRGEAIDSRIVRTVMLHKPEGVLTAATDPRATTVLDLLPGVYRALGCMPVGRLDKATTGLLLLTTDGELAHRLISPRRSIKKVYIANTDTELTPEDISAFNRGIRLSDFTALPAELEIVGSHTARITVTEGKYHQVRRMLAARGKPVRYLRRVREGSLTLEGLDRGKWRLLTPEELDRLQ